MPDAIELLIQQHRQTEQVLTQLRDMPEEQTEPRMQLAEQAETLLRAHMEIEEAILYPWALEVLGEEEGREMVQEAVNEHELGRNGLAQLRALLPSEPGVDAAVAILIEGITHHVREEESDLFPKLRERGGDQLEAVGAEMEQALQGLLSGEMTTISGRGSAELSDMSKDELVKMAKDRGIGGTSSMKKDELIQALSEQQ